jgi:hypothetical protein
MQIEIKWLAILLAPVLLSGCASYRTSSNVEAGAESTRVSNSVELYESGMEPAQKFTTIQRLEVSIKKLTLFHADPTKEQANAELRSRASALGCDAVANVQYQAGIGLTTWGYIDAQGNCIKFTK